MNTTHNATHTPLTWRTDPTTAKGAGSARLDIVSDGAFYSPSFVAGDILPEDAELIVRAVNNYADLLAALEGIANDLEQARAYFPGKVADSGAMFASIGFARAAISRAKGQA